MKKYTCPSCDITWYTSTGNKCPVCTVPVEYELKVEKKKNTGEYSCLICKTTWGIEDGDSCPTCRKAEVYKCSYCGQSLGANRTDKDCVHCDSEWGKVAEAKYRENSVDDKLDKILKLLEAKPSGRDPAHNRAPDPVEYTITAVLTSTYYKDGDRSEEEMVADAEGGLDSSIGAHWDIEDITAKKEE